MEKQWRTIFTSPALYHLWFQALDTPSAVSFWGWRALAYSTIPHTKAALWLSLQSISLQFFIEWCNLYYLVSFYCYLPCTICHSTTSFEVQGSRQKYSKIYLECIYIVRVWFCPVLFSLLFLISPNVPFWPGFGVCCLWEHRAHIHRTLNCIISFLNDNSASPYRTRKVKLDFSNRHYFTFICPAFHTSTTPYHFYNAL